MSTTATLESPGIQLEPGAEAMVPLTIRNDGSIVEEYRFDVVGPTGSWADVAPNVVSLYPGESATATLSFHPPRQASVPVGELSFGVRVVPTEHPEETVVPEGVIEVLPFHDTTAELLPHTSRGRRGARHRLAVDNRGNAPLTVQLEGTDTQDALSISVRPRTLEVPPGAAAFADVQVRPRHRIWRGESMTHPFTVTVAPPDGTTVLLDGTHLQEPVLPKWLFKAILAVLAMVAVLAALWILLLKPAIESTAQEAVKEPIAQAQRKAEAAAEKAGNAAAAASEAQKSAGDSSATAAIAPAAAPPTATTAPFSRRLQLSTASPGSPVHTDSYVIPEKATVKLTDVVMSNPQGDFGRLVLSVGVPDNPPRVLFDMALENFRDIDYHFVTPIEVATGQSLQLTITCNKVGTPPNAPPPAACEAAALLGGTLATAP